jgi:hypothetical protein
MRDAHASTHTRTHKHTHYEQAVAALPSISEAIIKVQPLRKRGREGEGGGWMGRWGGEDGRREGVRGRQREIGRQRERERRREGEGESKAAIRISLLVDVSAHSVPVTVSARPCASVSAAAWQRKGGCCGRRLWL